MLDEFRTDILGSLSEQLDTLKIHNKQQAEAEALAIFCPKCRKNHDKTSIQIQRTNTIFNFFSFLLTDLIISSFKYLKKLLSKSFTI